MILGDTIAAIASGPGRSTRAIIRLSGPATADILAGVLRPALHARGAHTAILMLDDRELPVQVLRFVAPNSYTGEDAAEILLPGNPHLTEHVLAHLLSHEDVRPAEPGEFSARAYLHGRMPLETLEGVAAIISAAGAEQLASARRILDGSAGAQYWDWTERAATLLALVEAGIDFSDQEDVTAITPRDLHDRAAALAGDIASRLGARAGRERGSPVPLVALAGPPNAGKSTLFNALLGRTRAVVSPMPGTTRDALVEPLELAQPDAGTISIRLADLAGLDAAPRTPTESAAQAQSLQALAHADIILACSDSGDWATHDSFPRTARLIRVRTKADRPDAGTRVSDCIPVCALDGWNLASLRRAIFDAAWEAGPGMTRDLLPRHRLALALAHEALDRLALSLAPHVDARALPSPELNAGSLRLAVDHLGQLTGRVNPDDIIGRIFASFCIGK